MINREWIVSVRPIGRYQNEGRPNECLDHFIRRDVMEYTSVQSFSAYLYLRT